MDSTTPRKVDVRLPGKGNSNSHGARPVHQIIKMIQWIRTSGLSIENSFSSLRNTTGAAILCRGGPGVIRKEAWPFYRSVPGVRLCWELEEPRGPKGPKRNATTLKHCDPTQAKTGKTLGILPVQDDRSDFTHSHVHYKEI